MAKMCSFFNQQGLKILNLLVLERQITKSIKRGINVNIELKRQNSQANRRITVYQDSNTSLRQSQANLIFFKWANSWVKQTELAKHTWQITETVQTMTILFNHSRTALFYSKMLFQRTQYSCIQRPSAAIMWKKIGPKNEFLKENSKRTKLMFQDIDVMWTCPGCNQITFPVTRSTTRQGVKLCLIQAPMQLNFSLWRPNPEN